MDGGNTNRFSMDVAGKDVSTTIQGGHLNVTSN